MDIELYNKEFKEIVDKFISTKLGVKVNMAADNGPYLRSLHNANVKEFQKKVINNKTLKYMFKDITLYANVYDFDCNSNFQISVRVGYTHPNGGSNGLNLFGMEINKKTKKIKYYVI